MMGRWSRRQDGRWNGRWSRFGRVGMVEVLIFKIKFLSRGF